MALMFSSAQSCHYCLLSLICLALQRSNNFLSFSSWSAAASCMVMLRFVYAVQAVECLVQALLENISSGRDSPKGIRFHLKPPNGVLNVVKMEDVSSNFTCSNRCGVTADSVLPQKLSPRTLSASGKCLPGQYSLVDSVPRKKVQI